MKSYLVHNHTIAALATPYGTSAIAVIRISGKNSIDITQKLIKKKILPSETHRIFVSKIYAPHHKNLIDEVMIIPMFSPKSYTGEDCVEIHCHGNMLIVQDILQLIYDLGSLPANPGEFTFRAFINEKVDLTQAEAISKMIHAKNKISLSIAKTELEGLFKIKISNWTELLYSYCSKINAWIDYPDDITPQSNNELLKGMTPLTDEIQILLSTYVQSKKIEDGYLVVLTGSPNTGKSSLLNTLLMRNRSIVSDQPGTTRDFIDEELYLGDCHIRLVDTAGIRNTDEHIEAIGVQQSRDFSQQSDLNLIMFDASKEPTQEEINYFNSFPPEKRLAVWNKIDSSDKHINPTLKPAIHISATKQLNIDILKKTISKHILSQLYDEKQHLLTTQRHYNIISEAQKLLLQAIDNINKNISPEFIQCDLTDAAHILSQLTGEDASEKILDEIFSNFCVGK